MSLSVAQHRAIYLLCHPYPPQRMRPSSPFLALRQAHFLITRAWGGGGGPAGGAAPRPNTPARALHFAVCAFFLYPRPAHDIASMRICTLTLPISPTLSYLPPYTAAQDEQLCAPERDLPLPQAALPGMVGADHNPDHLVCPFPALLLFSLVPPSRTFSYGFDADTSLVLLFRVLASILLCSRVFFCTPF